MVQRYKGIEYKKMYKNGKKYNGIIYMNLSIKKIISISFLVTIIFISLAVSQIYKIEGFSEGLISDDEKKNVRKILSKYVDDKENICKESIMGVNGSMGLNAINWDSSDEAKENILPIINDAAQTNSSKIDGLLMLNIKTDAAKKILKENTSSVYSITVQMLDDIKKLDIQNDDKFVGILKKEIESPKPNGNDNSYNKLITYIGLS